VSFIPYVWLGSTQGGLCWVADSDEGWIPTDQAPAIEVQRNAAGRVDLVLNLISTEATLDKPRTITFAFQASPVKPMRPGWREDNWSFYDAFTHDDHPFWYPWPKRNFIAKWIPEVKELHEAGKAAVPFVPYRLYQSGGYPLDKPLITFEEEWRTGTDFATDRARCHGGLSNDYLVHHFADWAARCGADGCYLDYVIPFACDNSDHGCGWRLPDGRVQPTFKMFATRELILRLRAAFLEQRPECKIVLNVSSHMILPWIGAADIVYDGGPFPIAPGLKKDVMDVWSLERLRAGLSTPWGVPCSLMHPYLGKDFPLLQQWGQVQAGWQRDYPGAWDERTLHLAMRAYFASVMLYDALPAVNARGHAENLIATRRQFGIGAEEVKFLPYWDQTGLHAEGNDIKLAGWQRPNKLLLLVANFGEMQTAQVALDLEKLGWKGATLAVSDPEQGQSLIVPGKDGPVTITYDAPAPKLDGTKLTVPVERHNYRLLVVEKKP